MRHVDFCLIADHDSDRRNGLRETISNNRLAKNVVGALNCGHGLLYLNQCFEKVEGKQIVVILNAKTPMMGGFEFLKELNKGMFKYDTNKVKIVILSDGLSEDEEQEYRLHGVEDFMECDIQAKEFNETLKSIFETSSLTSLGDK